MLNRFLRNASAENLESADYSIGQWTSTSESRSGAKAAGYLSGRGPQPQQSFVLLVQTGEADASVLTTRSFLSPSYHLLNCLDRFNPLETGSKSVPRPLGEISQSPLLCSTSLPSSILASSSAWINHEKSCIANASSDTGSDKYPGTELLTARSAKADSNSSVLNSRACSC